MYRRICLVCGNEFFTVSARQRTCCGSPFPQTPAHLSRRVHLRSDERDETLFHDSPSTRSCHDCGMPTTDYRCESCLAAWRMRHGVTEEDLECAA